MWRSPTVRPDPLCMGCLHWPRCTTVWLLYWHCTDAAVVQGMTGMGGTCRLGMLNFGFLSAGNYEEPVYVSC